MLLFLCTSIAQYMGLRSKDLGLGTRIDAQVTLKCTIYQINSCLFQTILHRLIYSLK